MAHEHKEDLDAASEGSDSTETVSRRQVLTAGLAAVGAGASALTASPAAAAVNPGRPIASTPPGAQAAEFRARFAQTGPTGENFTAYGYLTRADGAADDELFAGVPGEGTALLTAYAEGVLVRRTFDMSVHSLDIEGTLTIYQRTGPGASFDNPASFTEGTPVAVFAVTLQDIVTVFAPMKGIPTLTGNLKQIRCDTLYGPRGARKFGRPGADARLFATGLGTLTDPATSNSLLEMAGHWTMA
jgi:hypothetical protein